MNSDFFLIHRIVDWLIFLITLGFLLFLEKMGVAVFVLGEEIVWNVGDVDFLGDGKCMHGR